MWSADHQLDQFRSRKLAEGHSLICSSRPAIPCCWLSTDTTNSHAQYSKYQPSLPKGKDSHFLPKWTVHVLKPAFSVVWRLTRRRQEAQWRLRCCRWILTRVSPLPAEKPTENMIQPLIDYGQAWQITFNYENPSLWPKKKKSFGQPCSFTPDWPGATPKKYQKHCNIKHSIICITMMRFYNRALNTVAGVLAVF